MIDILSAPSFTADVGEHTDYWELLALLMNDRSASIYDLGRDLSQDGSLEELPGDEPSGSVAYPSGRGEERVQEITRVVTMEVERRARTCGSHYPFRLDRQGVLEALQVADSSVYVFLLLLTVRSFEPLSPDERKLFELVSSEVAAQYLGGGVDVVQECFGFPREDKSGFVEALQGLCKRMGEGSVNLAAESINTQKDGGVDVVALKRFPDHRMGQLTVFAQCATGRRWMDKLSDLQPETFMKLWMAEPLAVAPVKAFFIPSAIEESKWRKVAIEAGIPFDRTRITYHSSGLPASLREDLRDCNVRSLEGLRHG